MLTLNCPKCRQGMPDDALDAGQCPACGFPIDGPVVLAARNVTAAGQACSSRWAAPRYLRGEPSRATRCSTRPTRHRLRPLPNRGDRHAAEQPITHIALFST